MLELAVGIAGTAKNTGKTTATAAIMDELRERGIAIFLTSIGFDGENIDNITGLPKPKLKVLTGDVVATAERCLTTSTARLTLMAETGIHTPLGRVGVYKVVGEGLVVTAGPNKSSEVRRLREQLRQLGPGVTIFDGALNRIAPMAETDGFILATGASRTIDIPRLAAETAALWHIVHLPTIPLSVSSAILSAQPARVTILDAGGRIGKTMSTPSLLSPQDGREALVPPLADDACVYVPGMVSETALAAMVETRRGRGNRIFLAVSDAIKYLVAGELAANAELLAAAETAGIFLGVIRHLPLIAVTVNPFYPEYRFETKTYQPAYVDFVRLELSIRNAVNAPVFNIVKQGAQRLVDAMLTYAHPWRSPDEVSFD